MVNLASMNAHISLLPALLLAASFSTAPVHGAVQVTGSDGGVISQMPGSATDYIFFPNNSSDLTDFSVTAVSTSGQPTGGYGGNQYYSTIETPAGNSSLTGIYFQHSPYSVPNNATADLVTFTLGSSATFNYSNFDVFVLYSNADVGQTDGSNFQTRDLSFSLAPGSTALGGYSVNVTDTNIDTTKARYMEFNVQGLSAGETFTIAAGPLGQDPAYIGGVSFVSAPEPSTWALLLAGSLVVAAAARSRRLASIRA